MKNSDNSICWQGCDEFSLPLMVGLQTGTITVEINLNFNSGNQSELVIILTEDPNDAPPCHRGMCSSMFINGLFMCDSKYLETIEMLHKLRIDTENVVHFTE